MKDPPFAKLKTLGPIYVAQARRGLQRMGRQIKKSLRPPSSNRLEDRNTWYLCNSMLWAAILAATLSFNTAFAVRLGASNQLIGFLSSGQALIVILITLPAARFVEKRRHKKRWLVGSLLLQRLLYLVIAIFPFFVHHYRAEILVGLLLLRGVLMAPHSAGWNAFFADLVSKERRTSVMANRRIIRSAVLIVTVPMVGWLLDSLTFPLGYQLAYGLGFIASMVDIRTLWQIEVPEAALDRVPQADVKRQEAQPGRPRLRQALDENRGYVRYVVAKLIYMSGAQIISPLFIIFYLRYLQASDQWLGFRTSAANLSMMVGFYLWQKLIRRWGNERVMRWTTPLTALFPLLVSLSGNLTAIVGFTVLNGLLTPAINLSHFNILLEVSPAERRETYTSLYKVITNVASFAGPMLGVALIDIIGIHQAFFLGAGLRCAGGLMLNIWPPGAPRTAREQGQAQGQVVPKAQRAP